MADKSTSTTARKRRGGLHEARALVRIRAFAQGFKSAGAQFSKDKKQSIREFGPSMTKWGKMLDDDCDTIERAILRLAKRAKA